MHWSEALSTASRQPDGGPRSFPTSKDNAFVSKYRYKIPSDEYERLFWRASAPSQQLSPAARQSAGWLGLDAEAPNACKPVFVAHSTLAAIWLLRETLPATALPGEGWERLVRAAHTLASDVEEPPSAQVPLDWSPDSLKRAGLPVQDTPTKRVCLATDELAEGDDDDDEGDGPGSDHGDGIPVQLKGQVTSITNHNRRAEQQRTKRIETVRTKKREELGLHPPGEKAPVQERAAYDSIAKADEPILAWVIKQPTSETTDFYQASATPYFTACTLLANTRALGNQSSQHHAAHFLHAWRTLGTPFHAHTDGHLALREAAIAPSTTLSQRSEADRRFCFALSMCTRYESKTAAVTIATRWALALLGAAYDMKVEEIRERDLAASNDRSRNRYGRGPVRTEAITALLQLAHPTPSRQDHAVFKSRLKRGTRWHTIVQALGWGILMLIPHEEVSNRWVERVLHVGQLDVFVKLVKHQRPDLCAASKALEAWLGPDGIAGGSISGKETLSIEAGPPTATYEVEEIQDSEDDDTGDAVEITQSPIAMGSSALETPLRQMSLLELFHPLRTEESIDS